MDDKSKVGQVEQFSPAIQRLREEIPLTMSMDEVAKEYPFAYEMDEVDPAQYGTRGKE